MNSGSHFSSHAVPRSPFFLPAHGLAQSLCAGVLPPRNATTSGLPPFSHRSLCLSSRCCFPRGISSHSAEPRLCGVPPTRLQGAPSLTQFLPALSTSQRRFHFSRNLLA